jgi:hypothetical protein
MGALLARTQNLEQRHGLKVIFAGTFPARTFFISPSPHLEGKHSAFISHERTDRHT